MGILPMASRRCTVEDANSIPCRSEAASGFGVRSAHARSAHAEGRKPFATRDTRCVDACFD